jgi:predicted SprT family Zn-dependent metalloprotease
MITQKEYTGFQKAYDYFNMFLFYSELPPCLITIGHSKKYHGFFAGDRFYGRDTDDKTDEINLNADTFTGRTDKQILSTLVHEMCHLWQHHYGKSSRNGYHNKEWFNKMIEVGLIPTGLGQKVSHTIDSNNFFDLICNRLLNTNGFKLKWQSRASASTNKAKIKYSCTICGINAWGKPELNLVCGDCGAEMI